MGFLAGLVPGLHMNNIAALLSAYASSTLGLFAALSTLVGSVEASMSVSCFLSAALVAHIMAESVPSTYVGIPSGDIVSVLPAHRLARSGLGRSAVRASVDGAFSGVLASVVILLPVCLVLGKPMRLYELLRDSMGAIVVFFSCVLLASEGAGFRGRLATRLGRILRGALIFAASGLLGLVVLKTNYFSSPVPDVPWLPDGFTPIESLLLPMFAGLFGVPSLLLSLGSSHVFDLRIPHGSVHPHKPSVKDVVTSLIGGTVVGWMPGMTSGSAATLLSPTMRETTHQGDIPSSLRFIWLYSSISASGAVFSLGALFSIARARSGTMDAVQTFLGSDIGETDWQTAMPLMFPLAMSMVLSALISVSLLRKADSSMRGVRDLMSSRIVAYSALIFIISLSVVLSGTRGALVLVASVLLGLLPPLSGVRRIQLMGCLLVPIGATFL